MNGPDPDTLNPMPQWTPTTFLAPLAEGRENVEIGRFSYYDDREEQGNFFTRNVLHHYPDFGDKLIIGPFCAIAHGVRFFMNGGTHAMSGFSTFPFNIFGEGWEKGFDPDTWTVENRGDTVVGADVWIGTDAVIMPGVRIGSGAIIGALSVVTQDVPPYAVHAGNPGKTVKRRFDDATIEALLDLSWWDWPVEKITRNLNAIRGADLTELKAAI